MYPIRCIVGLRTTLVADVSASCSCRDVVRFIADRLGSIFCSSFGLSSLDPLCRCLAPLAEVCKFCWLGVSLRGFAACSDLLVGFAIPSAAARLRRIVSVYVARRSIFFGVLVAVGHRGLCQFCSRVRQSVCSCSSLACDVSDFPSLSLGCSGHSF